MNLNDALANQVGQIITDSNAVQASCFPVSPNVVVTCFHALSSINNHETNYYIRWPRLSLKSNATVILDTISPNDDIVFLLLDTPLPADMKLLPLDFRHTYNGNFLSFGYRKSQHYDGLFSTGNLIGEVRAVDGRQLLQLQTHSIDRGMSGAPILDLSYGTIVGMLSEYWATKSSVDNSLAFGIPISRLISVRPSISENIPELVAVPKNIKSGLFEKNSTHGHVVYSISEDELVFACTRLALLVVADQFADGAWGRSLWKETGIKITTDVADKDYVKTTHAKRALSATSWAAQALAKVSGSIYTPSVGQAITFALLHQDKTTYAFGNIYASRSATPFANTITFIRSPRHTASGIKLLELGKGINHEVVKGFEFIIRNECQPEGGWGEAIGDPPNTLSTAYVLDTLIKLLQIPKFKELLSPDIARLARPSVSRGMAWLIEQRDPDNLWRYADSEEYKPMYSANILGFVPQLVTSFYDDTIVSIDALLNLSIQGGIPATLNGNAEFTTTALCLYAMLRTDPQRYEKPIQSFVSWLVARVLTDEWLEGYSCMQGIFGLIALTQLPNIPRAKLVHNVNQMFSSIYEISDDPSLWIKIDKQFNLGLHKTIERLYS